jgi:hypothetical protein
METRLPQKSDGSEIQVIPPELLQELLQALDTIRFGSIELVIHDGRVVQLEKREKVRLSIELTAHLTHQHFNAAAMAPHTTTGRPDHRKPATSSTREE